MRRLGKYYFDQVLLICRIQQVFLLPNFMLYRRVIWTKTLQQGPINQFRWFNFELYTFAVVLDHRAERYRL